MPKAVSFGFLVIGIVTKKCLEEWSMYGNFLLIAWSFKAREARSLGRIAIEQMKQLQSWIPSNFVGWNIDQEKF